MASTTKFITTLTGSLLLLICVTQLHAQKKWPCISGNCKNGIGRIMIPIKDSVQIEGTFEKGYLHTYFSYEGGKIFDKQGHIIFSGSFYFFDPDYKLVNGKTYRRGADGKDYVYQEGEFGKDYQKLREGKVFDENGTLLEKGTFAFKTGELVSGVMLSTYRGKPAYMGVRNGYSAPEDYRRGIYSGTVTFENADGTELYCGRMKIGKMMGAERVFDVENDLVYIIGRDAVTVFPDKNGYPVGRIVGNKDRKEIVATNVVYDTVGINTYDYVPHILEAVVELYGTSRLIKNFSASVSRNDLLALARGTEDFKGEITGVTKEVFKSTNDKLKDFAEEFKRYWDNTAMPLHDAALLKVKNVTKGNYAGYEQTFAADRDRIIKKLEDLMEKYMAVLTPELKNTLIAGMDKIRQGFVLPAKTSVPN